MVQHGKGGKPWIKMLLENDGYHVRLWTSSGVHKRNVPISESYILLKELEDKVTFYLINFE